MYLPAAHLLQCRSILCLYPLSRLLLSCFYITSLWQRLFLWGDRSQEIFAPLCMESNDLKKSTNNSVASRFFAWIPFGIWWIVKYVMSWIDFSESHFGSSLTFSQFWVLCSYVVEHCRYWLGCPPGVMVKAMDCGIVGREFVHQSRYYVHFRANTLGKGMDPLIIPAMG